MEHYAAIKERLVPASAGRHAVDRRRRRLLSRRSPTASTAPASRSCAISVRRPLRDGIYVDGDADHASGRRQGATRSRELDGIGSLRGATMRRTRPARSPRRWRSASIAEANPAGPACRFPALRIAWKRSAARATCCSSTIPRRPMPMPPRGRWRVSPTSSGSPAASRKTAASRRSRNSSRASARPI